MASNSATWSVTARSLRPSSSGSSSANRAQSGEGGEGRDDNRRPFLARAYRVFNARQVEGFTLPEITPLSEVERDASAEAFFDRLPIEVRHEGSQAFYGPSTDTVHLPPYGLFKDANAYYATRGHESVHATGAKSRLDRDFSGRFG